MELKIIPKQNADLIFDTKAIKLKHIEYYPSCDGVYEDNADFAGTEELSPLESGGQSPIEKYLALKDIEAGRKAVEYFIRTGELYPGIAWAQQL